MSVPPLVCSTPPPPEQCYDEVNDDEFGFHYPDSTSISPTPRIDCEPFAPFDFAIINNLAKLNSDKKESTESVIEHVEEVSKENTTDNENLKLEIAENSSKPDKKLSEEECNIEDLDLKLDNLQIDFQNGKETVEDSLNATFDDFGTFLSSSNDATEDDPFYLPKIIDFQPFDSTSCEIKSNESSPEENVSIKSDENSNESSTVDVQPNLVLTSEPTESNELSLFENITVSNNDSTFVDLNNDWTVDDSTLNVVNFDCNFDSNTNNIVENNELKSDREEFDDITDFNPQDTDISIDKEDNITSIETAPEPDLFSNIKEIDFGNDDDFDDFATFESGNVQNDIDKIALEHNEDNTLGNDTDNVPCVLNTSQKEDINAVSDDDFGDFDTYNPSSEVSGSLKSNVEINIDDSVPINESDTSDKLFTATENVFSEDTFYDCDSNLNDENKYNLNKMLGENWSHLLSCDMDQSFLFPWNSSTSQKSLLKCLGIDSRNILFGPKWNTNMPRFALNLGTNPLQPIKQSIVPIDHQESKSNNDIQKISTPDKEIGWNSEVQYEAGDFQTSTYAESLLLDLENLMATLDQMTSDQSSLFKISDLFTSACNERDDRLVSQLPFNADDLTNSTEKLPHPNMLNIGRKINLPDTHIFTPTDSETPWSHTIHYSNENNFESRNNTCMNSHTASDGGKIENVDDFDDFQSFHSNMNESNMKIDLNPTDFPTTYDVSNKLNTATTSNIEVNISNVLNVIKPAEGLDEFGDFQSADAEFKSNTLKQLTLKEETVLQPIKVNLNAPTLNWPAPGDVNSSIFDDFSEMTGCNSNLMENFSVPLVPFTQPSFILKDSKIENKNEEQPKHVNGVNINTLEMADFNLSLPPNNVEFTVNNFKTDVDLNDDFDDFQSASFAVPEAKVNEPAFANIESFNQYTAFNNHVTQPTNVQLPLEPTPVQYNSIEYNSKSTQQILQPLSLENYSQINWPEPGIHFNNLSQFNPVNFIKSYDETKDNTTPNVEKTNDDDGWSDFVSTKPNNNQYDPSKSETSNPINNDDNDDWSDFVCNVVSTKNTCELKTISQNIHKQANVNTSNYSHPNQSNNRPVTQRNLPSNVNMLPQLSYVSPKLNMNRNYDSHFQNL